MNLQKLPLVLVAEIYKFIPLKTLVLCSKDNWINYYNFFLKTKQLNQSYLRNILRKDLNFVFSYYLQYYFKKFIKPRKIKYNSYIFSTYMNLIRHITITYDSQKCYQIVLDFEEKNAIDKKKYKKKKIKLNKWSN